MVSVPQSQRSTKEYSGFEKQLIAGEWKAGRGKGRLADHNPYNGEVLVEIPHADERDLDEAHAVAVKAQKGWGAALPADRSEIMRKAAQVMETRHDEIVSWLIAEAGSTRIKAELEWASVRALMLEGSHAPYRVEGRILASDVPGNFIGGGDSPSDIQRGIFATEVTFTETGVTALTASTGDDTRITIGNRYEGANVVYKDGYYYLFAAFDYCCRGPQSTYKMVVGRAKEIIFVNGQTLSFFVSTFDQILVRTFGGDDFSACIRCHTGPQWRF